MTDDADGLSRAEATALSHWLPDGVHVIGAGLEGARLLTRIEAITAGTGGLILAVIPPDSIYPPAEPARMPTPRMLAGAALLRLVHAHAPALAPKWKLNAVTGIEGADVASAREFMRWLVAAPSVTGQLVALDGTPPARGPAG